jgi:NAD(P)H-dependent FMN reductase
MYDYTILDLKQYNLPFYGETHNPDYASRVSTWEAAIAKSSAIIIVSPEYNHSIPGVLKNALDFGFVHWRYKPVSTAVLGFASAGARAGEHLRQILGALGTIDTREQLLFSLYYDMDQNNIFKPRDVHKKALAEIIDDLSYFIDMRAV